MFALEATISNTGTLARVPTSVVSGRNKETVPTDNSANQDSEFLPIGELELGFREG